MRHFLNYARYHTIDPPPEEDLAAEWSEVKARIDVLQTEDAGAADNPSIVPVPIDETYEPLLAQFLMDPLVKNGFNSVPTEVAFVELDQMVVYQKHIDLAYVRRLQEQIKGNLDAETIFRICLPFDHPQPPSEWARLDDDSFMFVSPSNDIRYLGTMQLTKENIVDHVLPGDLVGIVGVAIGYGSNFLNAIHAENRLILHNGSHRAYALRELGVTHVPCVVQHATTRDELELVAPSEVRHNPEAFFRQRRPAMLKDYFNPELRKIMPARREHRQIKVRFSVSELYVPSL